ncbi:MAG: HyaD/HybD family hydrogenase maturation endopeptidase [Pirellulales bacterium]
MQPTLILGIGNLLLQDEAVGVRVVEALHDVKLPAGVEVVDGGTAGANLVDLIADRRKLIVLDAIDAGAEPGTIFRLGPDDLLPAEGAAISIHQLGLVETLAMVRQLGCAPREVVIFGIQPRRIEPGLELTAEVSAAVPKVVRAVLAELGN